MSEIEQQADAIFVAVRDYIDDRIKHADADLNRWADELYAKYDARISALERAPLEYVGTYAAGKTFRRGQFATYGGSVWHCQRQTTQRPGDGSDWLLAVKAGRDAR